MAPSLIGARAPPTGWRKQLTWAAMSVTLAASQALAEYLIGSARSTGLLETVTARMRDRCVARGRLRGSAVDPKLRSKVEEMQAVDPGRDRNFVSQGRLDSRIDPRGQEMRADLELDEGVRTERLH
jgi:hypothetical protein